MSVNLTAKTAKGPIDLWQTPSWVTSACLVAGRSTVRSTNAASLYCRGKDAAIALEVYICWVKGQLDSVWDSKEELTYHQNLTSGHIKMVRKRSREKGLEVGLL